MTMTIYDPEFRAMVLAEVLKAVMCVPASATAAAIMSATMKAVDRPEEDCGAEILAAIGLLVRSGLVRSTTGNASSCTIAGDTVLTASPALTGFTWADSLCGDYPA